MRQTIERRTNRHRQTENNADYMKDISAKPIYWIAHDLGQMSEAKSGESHRLPYYILRVMTYVSIALVWSLLYL